VSCKCKSSLTRTQCFFRNPYRPLPTIVSHELTITHNSWFSGLLYRIVWWLDINVSEDRVASVLRIEMRGERKEDNTDIGRV